MAENDIYNSEGKYEKFKERLKIYLRPPEGHRQTQIKHRGNLRHFERLFFKLEARNCSYV